MQILTKKHLLCSIILSRKNKHALKTLQF